MDTSEVRYPAITVQLSENDGNAFSILSRVLQALKRANVSREEMELFVAEATSGDYDNLLITCMEWVEVL